MILTSFVAFPNVRSVLFASGVCTCIQASNTGAEIMLKLLTTMQRAKRQDSDQEENVIHGGC